MAVNESTQPEISLYISRSNVTTLENKTGAWRFARPFYNEKTAPCSIACPAGEDIAKIEMLASQGMLQKAWETILMENPLPSVCGRVCFHPCETQCNRQFFDDPVAIHHLERYLAETAVSKKMQSTLTRFDEKREKIAVVGAGPCGLSAAYFLKRLGYGVEVFESEKEPGGLLRWGIPGYRLPENILRPEIDRLIDMGIKIHCNQTVSSRFPLTAKDKFDSVIVCCGHGKSMLARIPGEEFCREGLEFLKNIRKNRIDFDRYNGTAVIVGGGNTAIDVARTLVRMNVKPIIAYRRRRQDMPAFHHEIEAALTEGVKIMELVAPKSIEKKGDYFVVALQKMSVIDFNENGRARVAPEKEEINALKVRRIFMAIGAEPHETDYLHPENNSCLHQFSHCRLSLVNDNHPVIYGGDLINENKSVPDAIASGKQAAMVLDTFFKGRIDSIQNILDTCRVGDGNALSMEIYMGGDRKKRIKQTVTYEQINTDYFTRHLRIDPETASLKDTPSAFTPQSENYTQKEAREESERCFNCGICNECDNCRLFCPEIAVGMEDFERRINLDYCKGCGICVVECPRNAMALEEEKI